VLVQVKGGLRPRLSAPERREIAAVLVPANVSKQAWCFRKFARTPDVERIA
jgi:hypothetical protein